MRKKIMYGSKLLRVLQNAFNILCFYYTIKYSESKGVHPAISSYRLIAVVGA